MLRRLRQVFSSKSNKISVVIPNFNNAKFIRDCIDSVISQTYLNFEIIFVDDKSSDDSLEVISSYNDRRITLIALDENVGISAVRNIGIKNASGHYLTTLDSDDIFYDKTKLAAELALIKTYKKKGTDIVAFSNIVRIAESGVYQSIVGNDNTIKQGIIFEEMLERSLFIPRDFLCLRDIYEEVGFYDEHIAMYEDWDLKLRIAKNYSFFYTGINGIGYRDRLDGLSKAKAEDHIKWRGFVYNKNTK